MNNGRKHILTLDIETIPSQRPDVLTKIQARARAECEADIAAITPPGNLKKPETIKAWEEEVKPGLIAEKRAKCEAEIDEAYRKTALNGAYGEVAVIGMAVGDGEPIALVRDMNSPIGEKELLFRFFDTLPQGRQMLVGHNVVDFDLRFLFQRAMVNQVPFPPEMRQAMEAKPWETGRMFDTMTQWAGFKGRISLDALCDAFGVPGKGDIDGSKVWDYVKAGRLGEIAEYCKDDVRKTRDVFKKMQWQSFLPLPEDVDVPY